MRKIVTMSLLWILLLLCAVGCGSDEEEQMAYLAGTWTMELPPTEDEGRYLLELMDLMEEEMVLIDVEAPRYAQKVEFRQDGTYEFWYDGENAQALVEQFYRQVFADLYENRVDLDGVYGQHFEGITEEQFYQLYADMYGIENFQILVQAMAANAYNYSQLKLPWETGTYYLQEGMIFCLVEGTTQEVSIGYEILEDTLTLTYIDGTEEYQRQ